jgi:hypothetical protein
MWRIAASLGGIACLAAVWWGATMPTILLLVGWMSGIGYSAGRHVLLRRSLVDPVTGLGNDLALQRSLRALMESRTPTVALTLELRDGEASLLSSSEQLRVARALLIPYPRPMAAFRTRRGRFVVVTQSAPSQIGEVVDHMRNRVKASLSSSLARRVKIRIHVATMGCAESSA